MPEILGEDDHRALALVADGDVDGAMRVEGALAEADFGKLAATCRMPTSPRRVGGDGATRQSWLDRHPASKVAFQADFRRAITPSTVSFATTSAGWGRGTVHLRTVDVQVRLVYGESDGMSPVAHAEWLQGRLPHSELQVIPGGTRRCHLRRSGRILHPRRLDLTLSRHVIRRLVDVT